MHAFRAAVEARDLDRVAELFHEDVLFHSPFAHRPFEGKDAATAVVRAVMSVFEDFTYTDELEGDEASGLVFRAKVDDKRLQGLDLIRTGDDGRIIEFTVMIRPANALMAVGQAMAPKVAELPKAAAAG
ncbi:nuclear transport factor 2 family protein [Conexibacter sp. SYSU D00693]|uniref:nuclear transport factor 2 family protein n=1 Tax=Conexibacter sp. SYSU D00693 TaxID=2812560 RepID=UPI00196AAFC3|nr:nuclear transport factor 2 family protein [Conexibacter sp. SYSU D00693]